MKGMSVTSKAELWGGPFDGETVDALPAPAVVTVFYDRFVKRLEYSAAALTEDDPRVVVLGYYWPSSPGRLTWSPE